MRQKKAHYANIKVISARLLWDIERPNLSLSVCGSVGFPPSASTFPHLKSGAFSTTPAAGWTLRCA